MKVTNYSITVNHAYISCDDVPAKSCSETSCSDCPFRDEDVSLEDLIKKYMEVYNAGN